MDSEDTAKMTAGPERANVESQGSSVIGRTITEEDAVGSVAPEMIKADGETQNRKEMPLPPSPPRRGQNVGLSRGALCNLHVVFMFIVFTFSLYSI